MCLLAIFFRVVEDAPLIVGANREELYARGGEAPQRLDGSCRAIGGRDPAAGGTWLGVNEHGVLIAVTNRLKTELPPSRAAAGSWRARSWTARPPPRRLTWRGASWAAIATPAATWSAPTPNA